MKSRFFFLFSFWKVKRNERLHFLFLKWVKGMFSWMWSTFIKQNFGNTILLKDAFKQKIFIRFNSNPNFQHLQLTVSPIWSMAGGTRRRKSWMSWTQGWAPYKTCSPLYILICLSPREHCGRGMLICGLGTESVSPGMQPRVQPHYLPAGASPWN